MNTSDSSNSSNSSQQSDVYYYSTNNNNNNNSNNVEHHDLDGQLDGQNDDDEKEVRIKKRMILLRTFWRIFVGTFKLWFVIIVLSSASVSIYITFYNYYIPRFAHVHPVYFVHDVACLQRPTSPADCRSPRYEILDRDGFFQRRQEYNVRLHLKMPDSDPNHEIGMFMIHLRLLDSSKRVLLHSIRPALFPYSSNYVRRMQLYLLSLPYLLHYYEETRAVTVSLLDEHTPNADSILFERVDRIHLELETLKPIEIVSSELEVTARLNTFQHLMYHWPLTTSIIVIFIIFLSLLFLSFIGGILLYFYS